MKFLLITLLFAYQVFAASSPGHLAMCSGVKQCLNIDLQPCSTDDKKPNKNIKYDSAFCAPFVELKKRGIDARDQRSYDIWRYMGREYRVIYKLNGVLPVSQQTMTYLFDNMDFTAELVNAYRKTKYTIKYDSPDRKYFSGDNGDNLFGSFIWLLNDSAGVNKGMQHVFFGHGRTKILTFKLHGTATAILDLRPVGEDSVRYEFRTIVSPTSAMLNGIMNMSLFSNVVKSKIQEIVDNIEGAAKEFSKGNRKPLVKYEPFKAGKWKKQIQEFEDIVNKKVRVLQ